MGKKQKTIAASDDALHKSMLEQLGLKSDSKEGQIMIKELKSKFQGGNNKKTVKQQSEVEEQQEESSHDHNNQEMDDGRLTLGDLFSSIGKGKTDSNEVINTNRLSKQIKELRKEGQVTALTAPMSGRKRLQIERQENYEIVKRQVGKWIPQVKHNREVDQLDFTTRDVIGEGGGVRLNSVNQIASNLRENQASSKMEKQIQEELQKQGLHSEKDLKAMEFESLKHVTPEQLEQRYQQIAQMKHLLFRQEHKNRRIAKIKSKLYHKLKKREKEREEKKLIEYLEQIDPEAAENYRMKEEHKKVEERLKQRHSSNNKFSKTLKRFGGMENENVREAFNEMIKEKNALKSRTKSVQQNTKAYGSDDSFASSSDQEGSNDEDLGEDDLKHKAVSQIEKELMELDSDESDEVSNSDGEEQADIKVSFNSKNNQLKDAKGKNDAKGIMGLKFMQRAEQNKKEMLKEQAKMLIDQIKEDQELAEESDKDQKGFLNAATTFSKKALPVPELKQQSIDDIKKAAQKLTGVTSSSVPASETKPELKSNLKKEKQQKKLQDTLEVTFDVNEDLKGFKTDQKKVISLSKEDQTLKNLFITQDEQEAIENFEKDKEQQVENELGKKVEAPKVARGWNEWAGDGVNEGRFHKRAERAEQVKKEKIEELKKKRTDARLTGVILNSVEERDKKFAQKFWVKELPHPFKNVKQFEALMTVPLGKDWNTIQSHKRLIQPEVLTKAGTIIKPLKFKKDLPLQTIEALVQHRSDKKEKRPAAKF